MENITLTKDEAISLKNVVDRIGALNRLEIMSDEKESIEYRRRRHELSLAVSMVLEGDKKPASLMQYDIYRI